MGVAITELLSGEPLPITDLKGKVLVVDAFNILYQFLTTIRMSDGTPLKDSEGRITSHLIGLFNRTVTLMSKGLKLVFVFDGEPPALKKKERERRARLKAEALLKLKSAEEKGDVDAMKKYSSRTARLTEEMIEESKRLLSALGLPVVDAPSEGEAQAAHMVAKGDAYAVVSQDADALLFGAERVVRNLSISSRRKKAGALAYEKVLPELFSLSKTLNNLGLTRDQLIVLAMLVGTDFNREGIKGIGPKKGVKLVKEFGEDFDSLFKEVGWSEYYDYDWKDVFKLFKELPVSDDYSLKWSLPDEEAVKKILVEDHDFNSDRIEASLKKIRSDAVTQKGLSEFF